MAKKYIVKADLGDILEMLTKKALAHTDKFVLHIDIRQITEVQSLCVAIRGKDFSTIAKEEYILIDDVKTDMDVIDDTLMDALSKLEIQSINAN